MTMKERGDKDTVPCKHEWEVNRDVPVGEEPLRYWKCSKCGVMGHRQYHGYGPKQVSKRKVTIFKCYVCGADARVRVWGRDSKGNLKWVCLDHAPTAKPQPV
jgi:hypothetical protein